MNEYDRGFNDGLNLVIQCLRSAATVVEQATYADFARRGDSTGATFRSIERTGKPHFAAQLRAIATEIETAMKTRITHNEPQT